MNFYFLSLDAILRLEGLRSYADVIADESNQ